MTSFIRERYCPLCQNQKRNFVLIHIGKKRKFICSTCRDWILKRREETEERTDGKEEKTETN